MSSAVPEKVFAVRSVLLDAYGIEHGFLGASHDARWEGKSQLEKDLGFPLRLLRQVHGTAIECPTPGEPPQLEPCEGDGWFLPESNPDRAQVAYGVLTADCVPVLLGTRDAGPRAALHCGWKGSVQGLLISCLEHFLELGLKPEQIVLAIGPRARACCYEIKADVQVQVLEAEQRISALESAIGHSNEKMVCDIGHLLSSQARFMGVARENIDSLPFCTICDPRFFSYRRQKELSGRQFSYVLGPF